MNYDPARDWSIEEVADGLKGNSAFRIHSHAQIRIVDPHGVAQPALHRCAPRLCQSSTDSFVFFCLTRIVCLFILFYLCFFFEVQTGLGFRFDLLHSGRSCRAGTGGCVDHCSFLCGRNSSPLCRHLSPSSSKESCFSFLFSWIILGNQTSISLPWRLTGVGGGGEILLGILVHHPLSRWLCNELTRAPK